MTNLENEIKEEITTILDNNVMELYYMVNGISKEDIPLVITSIMDMISFKLDNKIK